jgi:MFS family permease
MSLFWVLSSFDTPLRQSLIGSFVGPRENLPNALALNAMLFNAGRFVGPPLAGLLGLSSEAICFLINGVLSGPHRRAAADRGHRAATGYRLGGQGVPRGSPMPGTPGRCAC